MAKQKASVTAIDFSTYRTGELTNRIMDLLSVPAAFRTVMDTLGISLLVAIVLIIVIPQAIQLDLIPTLLISIYLFGAGVLFGAMAGLLRVTNRAVSNTGTILRLLLNITERSAADYARVAAGDAELPRGTDLLTDVYEQVFLETLETSVRKSLGILGIPALALYRFTLGRAVRSLIRKMDKEDQGLAKAVPGTPDPETQLDRAHRWSSAIEAWVRGALDVVDYLSKPMRRVVMLPLVLLLILNLAIMAFPLIAFFYLAT